MQINDAFFFITAVHERTLDYVYELIQHDPSFDESFSTCWRILHIKGKQPAGFLQCWDLVASSFVPEGRTFSQKFTGYFLVWTPAGWTWIAGATNGRVDWCSGRS